MAAGREDFKMTQDVCMGYSLSVDFVVHSGSESFARGFKKGGIS